jgi:hypothetical protein
MLAVFFIYGKSKSYMMSRAFAKKVQTKGSIRMQTPPIT